jgi:hypothetical protein
MNVKKYFLLSIVLISILKLNAQSVNFSQDIASIIYTHCTSCHRQGEIAPFALTNYNEIKSWGPMIKYVTAIKFMPPWKADHTFQNYLRENVLTDDQIQKISNWVDNGMPQGDPSLEPPFPVFPEGSQIREPDLVLSYAQSYTQKGINQDVYRYFAIPTGLTEDKDLIGLEIRPGNKSILHHALAWEDTTGAAAAADAADPEYGYSGNENDIFDQLNDQLPGYVPGQRPVLYSHGMSQRLHAGSYIKLQVHYAPTPIAQKDSTSINLFFAEAPVNRYVKSHVMVPLPGVLTNGPFYIPANQVREFHGVYTFTEKVSLLNISPHMHYLGKSWRVYAIKPDGDTVNLVRVNDWDFNWQGNYTFKKPIILPAGTKVHAYAKYDNTVNNPYNPNNPPRAVSWGERTQDEMYYLPFSWVSYRQGDEDLNFDEVTTSLENESLHTIQNELYPIYPVPANEEAVIGYTLNQGASVRLNVLNITGNVVESIYQSGFHQPGFHTHKLDVSSYTPGMYIVLLQVGNKTHAQKLVVTR